MWAQMYRHTRHCSKGPHTCKLRRSAVQGMQSDGSWELASHIAAQEQGRNCDASYVQVTEPLPGADTFSQHTTQHHCKLRKCNAVLTEAQRFQHSSCNMATLTGRFCRTQEVPGRHDDQPLSLEGRKAIRIRSGHDNLQARGITHLM